MRDHMAYRKPNVTARTCPLDKCRFLSLPAEIRLMVYEQLTICTRQDLFHKLYTFEFNGKIYKEEVKFTIITKSVPGISLLATCKQVSEEAWSILVPLLNQVTFQCPRFVFEISDALTAVASPVGPLPALIGYYAALVKNPLLTYREFLANAKDVYWLDPAAEYDAINNGYYKEYPFHYYPWMFQDRRFCNAIKKVAHQLVYHQGNSTSAVLDIGFKNTLMSNKFVRDQFFIKTLHITLNKWFGHVSVTINVRPIQHLCSQHFVARRLRDWPIPRRPNGNVSLNCAIDKTEWDEDWASREASLF
jgi:hypothetical protein